MNSKVFLMPALMVFLAACAPARQPASDAQTADIAGGVVYGTDDRRDLYQVTDARWLNQAASTVALVKSADLTAQPGGFSLAGQSYAEAYGLCAQEPFREQNISAFCSGSLVGPDLILTAGHCVRTAADCSTTSFVFGFAVTAPGVQTKEFASGDVYRCGRVVAREEIATGADYALIQLDRPVAGRTPLPVRRQGEIAVGQGLVVIGHPSGLPVKIAGGGAVRSALSTEYFVANLDTYGGNSGSAVFNADTGEIEGVLVRGDTDFQRVGDCVASVVRDNGGGRGEDVTRISKISALIPNSNSAPSGGGVPPAAPPALTVFTSAPGLAIPDNNRSGVLASLDVSTAPSGKKVVVSVKITHTYIGDLSISLIAADGRRVILHDRAGGSRKNLNVVYGRDEATARQLAPLSDAPGGPWKLEVRDLAARDVGTVDSFTLSFE